MKKALIIVAEDWSFLSHRVPLAQALKDDGFDVQVACRIKDHEKTIKDMGFTPIALDLARETISPGSAVKTIATLARLYKANDPDVIVHSSLFLSFLGSLAGLISGYRRNVNLITGLGFVFISDSAKAKLVRFAVKFWFRLFARLKSIAVVVQNRDDQKIFQDLGFEEGTTLHVIRGSGVDDQTFTPAANEPVPQVTFVGRILWAKGVEELVEAARILKTRNALPKIVLVGEPDLGNPQSATQEDIDGWAKEGLVECWGRRSDIANIYQKSTIAILPSWREGLPKSLLEAAACGLPMITTDVPGCREIVTHNENGLLVPLKDANGLADAIETLVKDTDLRQKFGRAARKLVEDELNQKAIAQKTLDVAKKVADL
ncbi:glycosyltransferase family 4 protein [Terasakiella sp. A23]|uniref:glycosyltransferase family 4 protein n=1 Tax=Terasakiella sp. FCG-A23 TaxID=3080561 RepID=UPI0029550C68|nr:glycosyltransferase family 4 protein [Terasakiella sp. A23]MDV7339799.1 glycosyltransferase family 4 protein [Terasakiella sp. A23]